MEAIVLAGGKGTRLSSVISDVPKPMAKIKGKPFLCYLFKWLEKNGIDKAILAVSYKANAIEDYFGHKHGNIKTDYSLEEEPLGTGGAIKQALTHCQSENVFIINGDTLFDIDLHKLAAIHNGALSIACRFEENADRFGLINLHDNKVVSYTEKKPNSSGLISGGIYLINRTLLHDYPEVFSFETEAMPDLVDAGKVCGARYDDYFIDIGIPEEYERANRELSL
jgi:D-glycero-alpha-D-manno-heptose 1-phosphate guanylyltransferase